MADNNNFALPKKNLIWMVLGFGVMVLGFVLLAPVVILLGCALVVFAIMHKGKNNKNS